jgi:hypothetical protein
MALESRISPREIQDRVRGGESADHVAQTAGVPLERVLRFVGPVLREREHVADQARRARLAGATGPSSLLGDLVARAATRRGVSPDDVTWDSARGEDHSWIVSATWPDGAVATWGLDLLRHQAAPLDPAARLISGFAQASEDDAAAAEGGFPDSLDASDFARFDADFPHERSGGASSESHAAPTDNVHQFVPRAVPMPVPVDVDEDPDVDTSPTVHPAPDVEESGPAAGDAHQAAADAEPTPAAPVAGGRRRAPARGPATPSTTSSRGSRRAKVPTWDDIMFGMKPKD